MAPRFRRRTVLALATAVLATGLARPATASSTFPPIIKSRWQISSFAGASADGCTLCHKTNDGGYGTATRPFGQTMLKLHVAARTNESLPPALDDDRARAIDSDGDSVSDYRELVVDHTNPNDAKDFKLPPPPVDAGEGGQRGASSTGGAEGGQPSAVEPPPETPPEKLPPPFEHGCAMATNEHAAGLTPLLVALAWWLGRGRARRQAD